MQCLDLNDLSVEVTCLKLLSDVPEEALHSSGRLHEFTVHLHGASFCISVKLGIFITITTEYDTRTGVSISNPSW